MEAEKAEFVKGKVCAWCSSPGRLCVCTPGVSSPAEIRSGIYNLAYTRFKEVYREKYQQFEYILTGKHRHKSHPAWHRASTIHKIEPDHSDLEEQIIERLIEDREKETLSSSIMNGLQKTELKNLLKRRLKKQRKNPHLLSMRLCFARAAILQA